MRFTRASATSSSRTTTSTSGKACSTVSPRSTKRRRNPPLPCAGAKRAALPERAEVRRFDAVVLDFDGVLVESVDVKTRAFARLYSRYGSDVEAEVVAYHLA